MVAGTKGHRFITYIGTLPKGSGGYADHILRFPGKERTAVNNQTENK